MKRTFCLGKMSFSRNVILFALFLFLACVPRSTAQVVRLYTNQHGLKTNYCNSVEIDSRGFVWISGLDILGFFDGTHFQYLPTSSADGHSLFQYAYGVKEMGADRFGIATSNGLYILNARNMDFRRVYLQEEEDSIYGYAINSIIDYPKENCYLITTDGFGTFVFNAETMEVEGELSEKLNREIGNPFVMAPIVDQYGKLWFSTTSEALMCIDLNHLQRHTFDFTPAAKGVIGGGTVTRLLELDGNILIGTNKGLLMYNERENSVRELQHPSNNLCIKSLIRTNDGRVLIGTDGRGIWEYTTSEGEELSLKPLYGQAEGFDISYGKVADMVEDSKGNIIAFFLQKGLVVIPPQSDCFHYHPISPKANGQNVTCVTSMTIDEKQNYWVATDGCGVFTTNGMKLATAYPVNEGLRSLLVQDVKIDKHGTVWAGSFGGGVQYFDNGKWTGEWLSALNQEHVMTMFYDEEGDRLLVGTNGNGVFSIDIAQKKVERMHLPFEYNQWVSCLLLDSQQTIWIATSSGLCYYSPVTGANGEIHLSDYRICNASALQQDGDEILIACDEGLLIYNIKTKKQELISKAQGLSSDFIRSITTTDEYIWLATRTNIASVDKKTHEVRTFSSFSGYRIGEFHRNSFVQPGGGYILFGGDNGIICFKPELIINRTTDIDHLYFTNFSTPMNTEKLDAAISYAKRIELENDNNSFSIGFSAVELGDPERIHYDYILEGHENLWHTEVLSPTATYSSLPSGNYTFRVRAHLEDTPTQYTENAIEIHVAAPWYASTWAFIIYFIILFALAIVVYQQIQMRKRQKEQLRLSAEKNRMKEAKLRLFTSITHELRSPLTMIESPLKQLMEEDRNPEHQSLYTVMQRNCNRLLDIVKQITDIRKIDSGQFTLKLEEQDYIAYSSQVFEQFKGIATVKDISFIVEHNEEELPMMLDVTHFEKILTNILSNAFKFTPQGGKVIARSGIVGDQVELRFYNSGSHFDNEDLRHLWERFYQGSAGSDSTGSGIGLNLVYELVKMHHGDINVKNIEPDGVEFTLHFPLYSAQPFVSDEEESGDLTILLVDDDTELAAYLTNQLKKDYKILNAYSGNSAWKKILIQRPDVVVTDYRMPDGNGMELCQLIKNHPETDSTPVIMLTGEGDETLQLHSLNIQVDHYLEKPVNIVMLRSAISQVLRAREKMRNKVHRTEMGKDAPKPVIENMEEKLYARINETLFQHIEDPDFSILQLSQEVGISRVHLNRKMKLRYGMSPTIFMKTFRLKQAAYLLANNKVSISEVVYRVGFSSHSYFTTAFREYFGMSPKEFVVYYSDEENKANLQRMLE